MQQKTNSIRSKAFSLLCFPIFHLYDFCPMCMHTHNKINFSNDNLIHTYIETKRINYVWFLSCLIIKYLHILRYWAKWKYFIIPRNSLIGRQEVDAPSLSLPSGEIMKALLNYRCMYDSNTFLSNQKCLNPSQKRILREGRKYSCIAELKVLYTDFFHINVWAQLGGGEAFMEH